MPGVFEDIRLEWGEKMYTIPADNVMRLLQMVEDVITMSDLHRYNAAGRAPLAKLAAAYAVALRYAGVPVADEEVYAAMFQGGAKELQRRAMQSVEMLLTMMVPPAAVASAMAAAQQGKKGKVKAADKPGSSPKRTRPQS